MRNRYIEALAFALVLPLVLGSVMAGLTLWQYGSVINPAVYVTIFMGLSGGVAIGIVHILEFETSTHPLDCPGRYCPGCSATPCHSEWDNYHGSNQFGR